MNTSAGAAAGGDKNADKASADGEVLKTSQVASLSTPMGVPGLLGAAAVAALLGAGGLAMYRRRQPLRR